jgi:hypothetical protein
MRRIGLFAEDAGLVPLLGGMEHAEDIVQHMNLKPTSRNDDFGAFLQELHAWFRRWSESSKPARTPK